MSQRLIVILAIIAITLGYSVYEAMKLEGKLSSASEYFKSNSILKSLPDLELNHFNSKDKTKLKDLTAAGNNLVVHFWATWCAPCEKELPEFLELTKKLENKDNVKFLFIAVNDKEKDVKKFLKKYNLSDTTHTLLLVDNSSYYQKSFGTYKLPETYVFSTSNQLLKRFAGPQDWMEPAFYQYLSNL